VEATIFMVLVIFSMFLMDFRRPSISRSVANVAALAGATLCSKIRNQQNLLLANQLTIPATRLAV
jgi:hypothetical protein